MKADLTRVTFDPTRHYAAVVHQQQRVLLDADLNEQQAIARHRVESESRDAIGPCGTPIGAAGAAEGFAIAANPAKDNLTIGSGHYYVAGMLCENEGIAPNGSPVPITAQPDLPANGSPIIPTPGTLPPIPPVGLPPAIRIVDLTGNPPAPAVPADGIFVAFLDAWLAHKTALENPGIREVALGGPDTASRLRTVWQVKLLRVGNADAGIGCENAGAVWDQHVAAYAPTGRLTARAEPTDPPKGPCVISPKAGYRRLENQLYRVEIHTGGMVPGGVRYKWSRDNGAIVVACTEQPQLDQIRVETLGRDKVLNLGAGHWVELSDDVHDMIGVGGLLYEVVKAEDDIVTVRVTAGQPLRLADFKGHVKLRRWDGVADAKTTFITLEDGIEVRFDGGSYLPGDYWLIPARTATGDIDWPRVGGVPQPLPRRGINHALCKLAIVQCVGGSWTVVDDCRELFPATTALTELRYAGGDGQEGTPNPLDPLRRIGVQPLHASVTNGKWPVASALVRFEILPPGDGLLGLAAPARRVDVATALNGIASCPWQLDATTPLQTVTATLLEGNLPAPWCPPITYRAWLSRAQDVSYDPANCPDLKAKNVITVQQAIDELCKVSHGGTCCCVTVGKTGDFATIPDALFTTLDTKNLDICLCLLPGDHAIERWPSEEAWEKYRPLLSKTYLKIGGCGLATRIIAKEQSLLFRYFHSLVLDQLAIVSTSAEPLLKVADCGNVTVTDTHFLGRADKEPLTVIGGARRVVFERCTVEAYATEKLELAATLIGAVSELGAIAKMAVMRDSLSFGRILAAALDDPEVADPPLLSRQPAYRTRYAERVLKTIEDAVTLGRLPPEAPQVMSPLFAALSRPAVDRIEITTAFIGVRHTLALSAPATALAFEDCSADATVAGNRIVGLVACGGETGQAITLGAASTFAKAFNDGSSIGAGRGRLRFLDNVVTGVRMGAPLAAIVEKRGALEGIYAEASVNDNRIVDGLDVAASALHVDGNTLGRGSGTCFAHRATLVGNIGDGTTQFVVSPQRKISEAANVDFVVKALP